MVVNIYRQQRPIFEMKLALQSKFLEHHKDRSTYTNVQQLMVLIVVLEIAIYTSAVSISKPPRATAGM